MSARGGVVYCFRLFSLQEGIKERELCVFFRNNHFNTMFKVGVLPDPSRTFYNFSKSATRGLQPSGIFLEDSRGIPEGSQIFKGSWKCRRRFLEGF